MKLQPFINELSRWPMKLQPFITDIAITTVRIDVAKIKGQTHTHTSDWPQDDHTYT